MPNAVVAINHSPWNADAVTNGYWNGMAVANYDLAWTTGLGNSNGFIPANTTASSYNGKTATYTYLHECGRICGWRQLVNGNRLAAQ